MKDSQYYTLIAYIAMIGSFIAYIAELHLTGIIFGIAGMLNFIEAWVSIKKERTNDDK